MRQPNLSAKQAKGFSYWCTKTNAGKTFGRVDLVSHGEALKAFYVHLAKEKSKGQLVPEKSQPELEPLTFKRIEREFLEGLKKQQLDPINLERKRVDVGCFASFKVNGKLVEHSDPRPIDAWVRRDFLDTIRKRKSDKGGSKDDPNLPIMRGLCDQSVLHAETAIRHLFRSAEQYIPDMKG